MGWKGHGHQGFSLGSTIDPVLERATCNVAVFRNCNNTKYMTVLVPFAGGPNAAFSLETAVTMVDKDGAMSFCLMSRRLVRQHMTSMHSSKKLYPT